MSDSAHPRFARQLQLPELGAQALTRLRQARVHVVGAGPTAGPALRLLAQAGVGGLLVDDGADVAPGDVGAWLYLPGDEGAQRALAAHAALRAGHPGVEVRLWSTGAAPTAALICVDGESAARDASERARRAGLPHVVGLAARGGGEVVVVPPGEPCFRCASPPAARRPPGPADAAAVGALAALELVLLLVRTGAQAGRRLDLGGGWPKSRSTARRPGCDCAIAY